MSDTRLTDLIAKWRERIEASRALGLWIGPEAIKECVNELEAAIAAPLVSPPGEPDETLQCLTCQRRTTLTEAVTRKFKHHRCAHCEESEGRSGCLLLVKPVYGLTPDYVPSEAAGERTPMKLNVSREWCEQATQGRSHERDTAKVSADASRHGGVSTTTETRP